MKKLLYITIIATISLLLGCKDFLEGSSQDLVIVKDATHLNEVLLGSGYLQSKEIRNILGGEVAPWLNYMDDDINTVVGPTGRINDYTLMSAIYGYTTWQYEVGRSYDKNSLNPDDMTWKKLYTNINILNVILNELERIMAESTVESDKTLALTIEGEAKFLRAHFYFLLVNLYADAYVPSKAASTLGVPLKLTHYVEYNKDEQVKFERTNVAAVYEQLVKDLTESIACFTESPQTKKLYRANKASAQILLSRVYLYMQDWENSRKVAEAYTSENSYIENMSAYGNETVFFTEENQEIVFSQGSLICQNNTTASAGDFCITKDLYELYDENDYRLNTYFQRNVQTDSIVIAKFRKNLHISYVSDIFSMRTSEAFLNLAEACAMLGDASAAHSALDKLLVNRIENYVPSMETGNELIDKVRTERRKELVFEGHRWFDLRRYAVNEKHPFKKDILRVYAVYGRDASTTFSHVEKYLLPAGDPAYTLQIPASVTEYDSDMPTNPRFQRKPIETEEENNQP